MCYQTLMLSIIIPTLNAGDDLPRTLSALVSGALEGVVKELIVVDGGSRDATLQVADEAGAMVIKSEPGRGQQLQAGGKAAKSDWLLFLHADTILAESWVREVEAFMKNQNQQEVGQQQAGVFCFRLDDRRKRARILEGIVKWRCRIFALPYGDQGLLISRKLYEEIGGFRNIALMEDVDIVSRLTRSRLHFFKTTALTSAARYKRDGYLMRMARNARCLAMWYAGTDPARILEKYQ